MNITKLYYAKLIVATVKHRKLPIEAAYCAIATALVESNLTMYANGNNPESLKLPHDAVGWDHGSVGLFQQQVGGAVNSTANWGTTAQLMNVASSTNRFLDQLVKHTYKYNLGAACQRVQGSAYPDRYAARMNEAISIVHSIWSNTPVPSQPSPTPAVRTYVVQPGDTLSGIATKEHISGGWERLQQLNHLSNPNLIYPHQVLRLS